MNLMERPLRLLVDKTPPNRPPRPLLWSTPNYAPRAMLAWENEQGGRLMQTTVNLPDSLYQKSEALAALRGATVEQLIVEAVKKEVQGSLGASGSYGDREVDLPVIRSKRPGTLDLSSFDFDDLLS